MIAVYVVVILALIAFHLGNNHLGVDDGILTETLVDAWPAGITP